ncbi:MAG: hypothetical protein NVSMB32_08230 [Actinomycetota bacterium]
MGLLRAAASTAFTVAIVLILAIFMLVEGPSVVSAFLAGIPDDRRDAVRRVGQTTSYVVSRYTLGVAAMGLANGVVTAAVLGLTGVPFVGSLAIWAGLVDILPIVGGLIGIVPAGLFAFAHSVVAGVVVVGVMFAYQQVKNHVLYPLAVGRAVQLNALLVIVAVLAGSELMGIAGALLAIPVAGALHAMILEFAPAPARAFLRQEERAHPVEVALAEAATGPDAPPDTLPEAETGKTATLVTGMKGLVATLRKRIPSGQPEEEASPRSRVRRLMRALRRRRQR